MIYFDSAATTLQKPASVANHAFWAVSNLSSPGRGQYKSAELAAQIAYDCREKAAALFNVKTPENILFTFNATHGLNIAINSLVCQGSRVVVSGYEHNAVLRPLVKAGAEIIVAKSKVFDKEDTLGAFEKQLRLGADVVVCTTVSNVFGFILPVYEIAELCKSAQVPLIIDASQGAGIINLDFSLLGCEFMAMPGHKGLYGLQGTGLLICKDDIKPFVVGGTGGDSKIKTMPDYLPDKGEAGTHNMPGIAGLSAGIDYVLKMTPREILLHERKLLKHTVNILGNIKDIELFTSEDICKQSGVLSFRVNNSDCHIIAAKLADAGICTRAGLHCAPLAHKSADTLDTGTVRISFSAFNTKSQILRLGNVLERIIK